MSKLNGSPIGKFKNEYQWEEVLEHSSQQNRVVCRKSIIKWVSNQLFLKLKMIIYKPNLYGAKRERSHQLGHYL